jgi:hypothetical protein
MAEENRIIAALDIFEKENVEAILIGGAAVILHGSAYVTQDVDFCCSREVKNLESLAKALNSVNPRFRVEGIPEGMPTKVDARTFRNGEAFSFITDIGNLDVRFSVDGIGIYEKVAELAENLQFGDRTIRMLSVDGIIQSKRAMGRPRDLLVLPELEMMRESRQVHDEGITPSEGRDDNSSGRSNRR